MLFFLFKSENSVFVCCKYTKKEASNPRKVTDFLKNYSLRDNLVSEDYQASCFVLQIYKKSNSAGTELLDGL
nr:MAG TPA: hypothetical protein [Caudoviricetes sp.]